MSNLRAKIDAALAEVATAETMLEAALRALRGGPRAEKVKVTEVVETAFTRVRSAREELAKIKGDVEKA